MTPKEKAEELFDWFYPYVFSYNKPVKTSRLEAIKCAMKCVDEIIPLYGDKTYGEVVWWKEVKEELQEALKLLP